jgi:hypothetical protein
MLTVVESLPPQCRGEPWSFGLYAIVPFLKKSKAYTPDPAKAVYHLLPERNPWSRDECTGLTVHRWLEREYAPYFSNNRTNIFIHMSFCDLVTDCSYTAHPEWMNYPPEFRPSSPSRRYMYLAWNGRADGADDDTECTGCIQNNKDIVLPTAENACGPLCGHAELADLRRLAVWNSDSPKQLIAALQYVRTWPKRPIFMYWSGQVRPNIVDFRNDISGRAEFYHLYGNRTDSVVINSYDWDNDVAVKPDAPPVLETMRNSTFCFSPLGRIGGDHDRYIPALLTGCIPILLRGTFHNGKKQAYNHPFSQVIDWQKVAVLVEPEDVSRLPEILGRVNVQSKRAHVFDVWRRLLYTSHYGSYLGEDGSDDALHTLIDILHLKLNAQ